MQTYHTKKIVYKNSIKYIVFKKGITVYEKGDKYENTDTDITDYRATIRKIYRDTGRITHKHESVIQRARQTVFDLVATNDFDYFATFTFAPSNLLDRYSFTDTSIAIRKYLKHSNIKKYVLVYEQHKDGAYHYHALINLDKKHLKKHTRRVYNIKNYKYGFSTAVKIKHDQNSNLRLAGYLVKYMTKQFYKTINQEITKDFKYKKLYWCSQKLNRPKIEYNVPVDKKAKFEFENEFVCVTIQSQQT